MRREKIAVAETGMAFGRRQRTAAKNHLVDHELAVVFAERAFERAIARVSEIRAPRPLPDNAEGVGQETVSRGYFPFEFGRKMLAGPARERVGLEIADMANRRVRIDRFQSAERKLMPFAVDFPPVKRRFPRFRLHRVPAVGKPESRRLVAAVPHEF